MHVPGLAKVLLGRGSKDSGLAKCVRVDSVGLAKRRLAAKAAQEEQVADGAEQDGAAAGAGCPAAAEENLEPEVEEDDLETAFSNLIGRQHRDSLRIHRRRFRERASVELRVPNSETPPQKILSWSSGGLPSAAAVQETPEDDNDGAGESNPNPHERASCPATTVRRVRIRRASDGEYLTTTRAHKAHHNPTTHYHSHSHTHQEGGLPHALRAVQQKAERLFRRLTAHFTEPSSTPARPRSATSSRGISPSRAPRSATSRNPSTTRSSASWRALRHRSIDAAGRRESSDAEVGGEAAVSPSAAAAAATSPRGGGDGDASVGPSSRRAKRQSAPGELLFTSLAAGGAAGGDVIDAPEPCSPPLCPAGTDRASSLTSKGGQPAGGRPGSPPGPTPGKGRNWLARLSRGLTSSSSSSHAYKASATPASPPAGPSQETKPAAAAAPAARCTFAPVDVDGGDAAVRPRLSAVQAAVS